MLLVQTSPKLIELSRLITGTRYLRSKFVDWSFTLRIAINCRQSLVNYISAHILQVFLNIVKFLVLSLKVIVETICPFADTPDMQPHVV